MAILTRSELDELANQYGLPVRQLVEAQEVMLFTGVSHDEIRSKLPQICDDANVFADGNAIGMFDRLLKGFIALVEARNSPNG